jgi:ankyrin repeat protein
LILPLLEKSINQFNIIICWFNTLQAAVENGNIQLVEILLNAGGEVNAPPSQKYGITAIQAAVIRGHIRVAQLLLNAGADVNAAPAIWEGRTALEGAAEHGRIDLL